MRWNMIDMCKTKLKYDKLHVSTDFVYFTTNLIKLVNSITTMVGHLNSKYDLDIC